MIVILSTFTSLHVIVKVIVTHHSIHYYIYYFSHLSLFLDKRSSERKIKESYSNDDDAHYIRISTSPYVCHAIYNIDVYRFELVNDGKRENNINILIYACSEIYDLIFQVWNYS